ncbi:MAG: pilus assembly protein PilY, partial [Gammaproteobacteria bacterium]
FKPQGGCIPPAGSPTDLYKNSNFPDGNVVEKGAAGHQLRSSTTRNLKTCPPIFTACQNPSDMGDFNTGNTAITATSLDVTATERDSLINWSRGLDVNDPTEKPGNTATNMRPSVHGDIVHSRPVAINFGTDSSPKVVVFYGGNDGVFRAINGNRSASIGSTAPGQELWSFMPPEFYKSLKRLRSNSPQVKFKIITAPDALAKPYGLDGAVTAHYDGSDAWIYTTMRRGGRVLYAFDVDVTDPSDIRLKWKRGCPNKSNDTDCSSGFDGIGETWSQPQVFKASGYNSGNKPLLIMGGGHDTCEDTDPNTCTASSKGRKIYVLDADNGSLRKTFDTDRPVIADVFVVPDLSTGLAKYAYTAD